MFPSTSMLRAHHDELVEKNVRVTGWGTVSWNAVFWTYNSHCTPELTAALVTYIRPLQVEGNKNSHITAYSTTWTLQASKNQKKT